MPKLQGSDAVTNHRENTLQETNEVLNDETYADEDPDVHVLETGKKLPEQNVDHKKPPDQKHHHYLPSDFAGDIEDVDYDDNSTEDDDDGTAFRESKKPRKEFVVDKQELFEELEESLPVNPKFWGSIIFNFSIAFLVLIVVPIGLVIFFFIGRVRRNGSVSL